MGAFCAFERPRIVRSAGADRLELEAIALPAHGRRYFRSGKGLAVFVGRVLNAAIRMLE